MILVNFIKRPRVLAIITVLIGGICFGTFHMDAVAGSPNIGEGMSLLRAKEVENIVVSCRDAVGMFGQVPKGVDDELWRGIQPDKRSTIFRNLRNTSALLVYIHGHDTTLESAIERGNQLASYAHKNLERDAQNKLLENQIGPVSFITFAWKSDFGKLMFSESVKTAVSSGPCLARFIIEVKEAVGNVPIILISHSLGSKITLEAFDVLWSQYQRPMIELLILVQAAIPWSDLYSGSIDMSVPPQFGDPGSIVFMDNLAHEGSYYSSINVAKKVVATCSATDSTLKKWYKFWSVLFQRERPDPITGIQIFPDIFTPLGLITEKGDWKIGHKNYEETFQASSEVQKNSIDSHSIIFDDPKVFDRFWKNWIGGAIKAGKLPPNQ